MHPLCVVVVVVCSMTMGASTALEDDTLMLDPYYHEITNPEGAGPMYVSCSCGDMGSQTPPCDSLVHYFGSECFNRRAYMLNTVFPYMDLCPIPSDAATRVGAYLRKIVQGQSQAIEIIENALNDHLNMVASDRSRSPLVLHFAGDNGVGKSLAANVISTYLFDFHMGSKIDAHRATKLISGNYYAAQRVSGLEGDLMLQTQQQKFREELFSQLKSCKNSVFILNDLEKMDMRVFQKIEDFLDGTAFDADGTSYSTKDAIFILTSDLGSAASSFNWDLTRLEKESRDRFSAYVNGNNKLITLVHNVPFITLTKEAFASVMRNLIASDMPCFKGVECIHFENEVAKFLAGEYWSKTVLRDLNGRASRKLFAQHISSELKHFRFTSTTDDRRNITLRLDSSQTPYRVVASHTGDTSKRDL